MSQNLDYIDIDNLSKNCPSYLIALEESTPDDYKYEDGELRLRAEDGSLLYLQNQYMKKVEEGNHYFDDLQNIEKRYIMEKYGPDIYNYILEQRNEYNLAKCDNMLYGEEDDNDDDETNVNGKNKGFSLSFGKKSKKGKKSRNKNYKELKEEIDYEYEMYKKLEMPETKQMKHIVKDYKSAVKDQYQNMKSMENETELDKRKIEYRLIEYNRLRQRDNFIDVVYYLVVIALIILLYSQNRLNIVRNWKIYLLLIILPYGVKYIYDVLIHIFQWLRNFVSKHGPKNAFVNTNNIDYDLMNGYNI